jgi:hypothetical protein
MCQSVALPSTAEYWHIGEIMMRLGRLSLPKEIGEKSLDGVGMKTFVQA